MQGRVRDPLHPGDLPDAPELLEEAHDLLHVEVPAGPSDSLSLGSCLGLTVDTPLDGELLLELRHIDEYVPEDRAFTFSGGGCQNGRWYFTHK